MSPSESTMNSISVIIPCYNNEKTIREAIESVIHQTWAPLEIIVVDDGSTDSTIDILKAYKNNISLIEQVHQERAVARNSGIRMASGKWIAFLDADDVWLPSKLEKQAAVIEKDPDISLSYTQATSTDRWGKKVKIYGSHYVIRGMPGTANMLCALLKGNPITLSTVLVKRNILERYGLFNEKLVYIEDWELWMRLASSGCLFHFLSETTTLYRYYGK